jgi:hypothetical protein
MGGTGFSTYGYDSLPFPAAPKDFSSGLLRLSVNTFYLLEIGACFPGRGIAGLILYIERHCEGGFSYVEDLRSGDLTVLV